LIGSKEKLPYHLLQNINIEKKVIMLKLEDSAQDPGISVAGLGTERRHVSELRG
jgi:hypothetical protein